MRNIILQQQPASFTVEGDEYPAPPEKVMLANIVSAIQMITIALIVMGDALFNAIGKPVPQFIKEMQESKWSYCIGAFFIGNGIAASLRQTGAFEIYVDDVLVFSKLESGDHINAYQL